MRTDRMRCVVLSYEMLIILFKLNTPLTRNVNNKRQCAVITQFEHQFIALTALPHDAVCGPRIAKLFEAVTKPIFNS